MIVPVFAGVFGIGGAFRGLLLGLRSSVMLTYPELEKVLAYVS